MNIIKNPFFWIILAIIVSIIVLVVLNKKQSKITPRPTCKTNESLCGDECIDTNIYDCVSDQKCKKNSVGKDDKGNIICCPDDKYVDSSGNCVKCANKLCNNQCCSDPKFICAENGTTCCDPDFITDDDECCTEDKGQICKGKDGKTTCCSKNSGKICVDGICVIGCPPIGDDPKLNMLYTCPGESGPLRPDNPFNCTGGNVCAIDCTEKDPNKRYSCVNNQTFCNWDATQYDPVLLDVQRDQTKSANSLGQSIPVCKKSDGSLWIKNMRADLSATAYTKSIVDTDHPADPKCNIVACENKIIQHDTSIVLGNVGNNFDPNTRTCSSILDCSKSLFPPQTDIADICSRMNKNATVDGYDRCCKDSNGNNTGQICEKSQFCYNGTCYNGFEYDDTTKRCIPSTKTTSDIYKTVDNCLSDKSRPMCNKNVPCTDWKTCYCCPFWSSGDSCQEITLKVPDKDNKPLITMVDYKQLCLRFNISQTTFGNGGKLDNYLLIVTPLGMNFSLKYNAGNAWNFVTVEGEAVESLTIMKDNINNLPYDIEVRLAALSGVNPNPYTISITGTSETFPFTANNPYTFNFDYIVGGVFTGPWQVIMKSKGYTTTGSTIEDSQNTKDANFWAKMGDSTNEIPGYLWVSLPLTQ